MQRRVRTLVGLLLGFGHFLQYRAPDRLTSMAAVTLPLHDIVEAHVHVHVVLNQIDQSHWNDVEDVQIRLCLRAQSTDQLRRSNHKR